MAPKFDIQCIPPEIWTEIFGLACLDDGTTCVSLSQVSRSIRSLSEDHRYTAIKINSTPQLFKLQDVLTSKGKLNPAGRQPPLRTRFLCIILPESTMDQAYPEDSFVPEDDPEDQPWRGCHLSREDAYWDENMSMSSGSSSTSEEFDSDDVEFEYEVDADGDGEMDAEIAELQDDALHEKSTPAVLTIANLSELRDVRTASSQLEYRVFSAIRQLLEACSSRLEAFTLWIYPKCLVPLEVLLPPLPNLTVLSIGVNNATWTLGRIAEAERPAQLFPALCRLRLLAKITPSRSIAWWKDVIQLTARGRPIKLTTSLPKHVIRDSLERPNKSNQEDDGDDPDLAWFDPDEYPSPMLREMTAQWWLEDIAGGSYSSPPKPPVRVRLL